MTEIICCSECSSTDVETAMWVNHVTGEANGYFGNEDNIYDEAYNYCNNCKKNVELKIKEV
jgi:hypothetical protein